MEKYKYNVGDKFNDLKLIERLDSQNGKFKCTCGEIIICEMSRIGCGKKKHCGCKKERSKYKIGDIIGNEFKILELLPKVKNKNVRVKAQCSCGNIIERDISSLLLRKKKCENCSKEKSIKGFLNSKFNSNTEMIIYYGMKGRCYNKNNKKYKDYGGRGIKVCDRWLESFWNFYEDMGKRPSPKHTLDRINVNGDYCPENCKWSTHEEQANNRRNSLLITYEGKTQSISQWARELNLREGLIRERYHYGYAPEKMFSKEKFYKKSINK